MLDAVLGNGPNNGLRAEIDKLKASVSAMGEELRALGNRLAVYTRELDRRD